MFSKFYDERLESRRRIEGNPNNLNNSNHLVRYRGFSSQRINSMEQRTLRPQARSSSHERFMIVMEGSGPVRRTSVYQGGPPQAARTERYVRQFGIEPASSSARLTSDLTPTVSPTGPRKPITQQESAADHARFFPKLAYNPGFMRSCSSSSSTSSKPSSISQTLNRDSADQTFQKVSSSSTDIISQIRKVSSGSSQSASGTSSCSSEREKKSLSTVTLNGKASAEVGVYVRFHSNIYGYQMPAYKGVTPDSEWNRISVEITQFMARNLLDRDDFRFRILMWKKLNAAINQDRHLKFKLIAVGSTVTGLATKASDLDLCLISENRPNFDHRWNAIFTLHHFLAAVEQIKEIEEARLIIAKVPLVKLKLKLHSNLSIDVTCNNSVSAANSKLLYSYSRCDVRFQLINYILIEWFHYHYIDKAIKRTCSSYIVSLLLIHFLQYGVTPEVLPCIGGIRENFSDWSLRFTTLYERGHIILDEYSNKPWSSENTMSVGELLYRFFSYYGNFCFEENVISVRTGLAISKNNYKMKYARQLNISDNEIDKAIIYIEEPFSNRNAAYPINNRKILRSIQALMLKAKRSLEKNKQLSAIFTK